MRLPRPTDEELISASASVINPKVIGDRLFGDVGCALISRGGNLYLGVCIDTASGTGFCAEHSAIAAMVTAGEYGIEKIVAVWKDDNGTTCCPRAVDVGNSYARSTKTIWIRM